MNLYPEQLRQVAAMCEALNAAEGVETPTTGMSLMLAPVQVVTEDGSVVGELRDEIGGSWSFTPGEDLSKLLATQVDHG